MPYLPAGMPVPQPNGDDAPFWQGCRDRQLVIRHCNTCERHFHPPMPSCPRCGGTQVDWRSVSGNGTVFSYTVISHPVHPALKGHAPYNVVVVLLDDAGDVRLVSNLVGVPAEELTLDMPVSIHWDDIGDGMSLPRFQRRPAAVAAAKGAA